MDPWITLEECDEVAKILDGRHKSRRGNRYFEVEGWSEVPGVYLTITLRDSDGFFVYPVEGRIETTSQNLEERPAGEILLDFISCYFDEYMTEQNTFLPLDWFGYEKEGVKFQLKGQIRNMHLEAWADRILDAGVILK